MSKFRYPHRPCTPSPWTPELPALDSGFIIINIPASYYLSHVVLGATWINLATWTKFGHGFWGCLVLVNIQQEAAMSSTPLLFVDLCGRVLHKNKKWMRCQRILTPLLSNERLWQLHLWICCMGIWFPQENVERNTWRSSLSDEYWGPSRGHYASHRTSYPGTKFFVWPVKEKS